jgi:hypothetical protein
VQVDAHRTDGAMAGEYILGALSEVQTVTFRGVTAAASVYAGNMGSLFQLGVGAHTTDASFLEYGSPGDVFVCMPNVHKVTVTRHGDGLA